MLCQATMHLKVPHSDALIQTMIEFSNASQFAYNYARKNKINSWKTLHQRTYKEIRQRSKLPSQLCCKAIKFALETKKGCRNRKADFSKELTIQYDKRSYSFDFSGKCSLSTINGRIREILYIPDYYLERYKEWDIRSAGLSKNGKELYLNVVVCREISPAAPTESSKIVGVDLGINNIAVSSERQFFSGVGNHIAKLQRLRSQLQSKGTTSAKKHLKKLSGRMTRFMRTVNHEVSRHIVSMINAGDIIVMENLHGIRRKQRGKKLNGLLSGWAFCQLRAFVEYKTVRKGAFFVVVPPHYTSKTCSRCNEIFSERPGNAGFFRCLNCDYSCNADLNASFNLRKQADALRNTCGLFVNQPIVAKSY